MNSLNNTRFSSTALACALAASGLLAQSNATSQPVVPDMLLNEVMFDQVGVDAQQQFGSEWIELYARRAVNLADWSLSDNLGQAIGRLPNVAVPADTYVLIVLGGLAAYDIDGDASDGTLAYTLGMPNADHLANAQANGSGGGVRLSYRGRQMDSIYWGNGAAPRGSAGDYFDVSFATGRPLNEGDTLGRSGSPVSDFTGKSTDWDRCGGINAAGATPKQRNGVYPTDSTQLLKWAQSGICQIVNHNGYTSEQYGQYNFQDGLVANVQISDLGNSLTVVADHTLVLDIRGVRTDLTGTITASMVKSEAAGRVGYTQRCVGTMMTPAGWGLTIDYSEAFTGMHTNTVSSRCTTDLTWHDSGSDYDSDLTVDRRLERTGDNTWQLTDNRTATDFSFAGVKTSQASTVLTRTSDGVVASSFEVNRDMPFSPPRPGTNPDAPWQQRLVVEGSMTSYDNGEYNTVVSRYDEFEDGVLIASLRPNKQGSIDYSINPVTAEEPMGSSDVNMVLPLIIDGRNQRVTSSIHGELIVEPTRYLSMVRCQINANGFTVNRCSLVADPPLAGGSGSSGGDKGFGGAVKDCVATGAAVGTTVGGVAGGVAGAVGGAGVGGAVGALGGPPGVAAAVGAGGVKGAAAGTIAGGAAGGAVGAVAGGVACAVGHGAKKVGRAVGDAWDWVSGWF